MRNKIAILPKLYDANGDIKKKWFIFFSYKNPASGKMTRFRIFDGFGTLYTKKARYAHAEKLISDYTQRLQNGWNPFDDDRKGAIYEDNLKYAATSRVWTKLRSDNKTFTYYANLFLPEVEGMATKTYKNYVSKFRTFNAWLEKNRMDMNDIRTISPDVMQDFFLYLINDLKLARITTMKYQHMLERLFNWCLKHKYIKVSPIEDLPENKRRNDQAPRPVHEADIDRFVTDIQASDPQLWLTIQLEYYCFLRPGLEIRLARVGWFDLARGVISIPGDVVKTDNAKTVIIPDVFREYLLNTWRLHLYPAHYYLIGPNGMPGTRPLGENNLRNRFNVIRDRLNLPSQYKLYSWKHTGNARAADAGIPMYHRQLQNGHASIQSTEEYLKNKIGFESQEIRKQFPVLKTKTPRPSDQGGNK